MQNKGLIKLFAILFGLVSLYQLSFTFFANRVEDEAKTFAKSNVTGNNGRELAKLERKYLDSVANKDVINLGFAKYSYNDIKNKEMNLGLDLKGGINAILQVSVKDILVGLSNNSKNAVFNEALAKADEAQKDSQENYLDLFFTQFENLSNNSIKLSDPAIFGTKALREKIDFNKTNAQVKEVLQDEINSSINTAFEVLRSRIDKFGVVQPSIQRIGNSGRIQVELPGAKDIERVQKLLQSTAELQFWEVFTNIEVQNFFFQANAKATEILKEKEEIKEEAKDSTKTDSIDDLLGASADSTKVNQQKSLFTYLYPNVAQNQNQASSLVAQAKVSDTAMVNKLLKMKEIRSLLPKNLKYAKFLWDYKAQPSADKTSEIIGLYAIKSNRYDEATIDGDVIADAKQEYDQLSKPVVSMLMNGSGTKKWAKMTGENVGKFVAVVLDNYVYTAPIVNGAITGGSTQISGGQMTVNEAQDIATVLKAGKLPAPARIIQAEVVGPSLGKESINASMWSFGLAILLVLIWMLLYYGKAGLYANIALLVNILFIFGILASFNSVLTLPGIAGIILTIGMSVDANVIIFERIKEGLTSGKGLATSVEEGFSVKGALSAIIDANITTLLTGIILYVFGTGPIKGFALTLMIGIATSLFTAVFITRLLIDGAVLKGANLTFNTNISKNWFQNISFKFLQKRKAAYIFSGAIILAGLISIFSIGLKQGVDFKGGRSYVVRFDQPMNATEVASALKDSFGAAPEVKTYGADNQLKITTVYKIDEEGKEIDESVQSTLFTGLKPYLGATSYEDFKPGFEKAGNGIMSYMKVEPTIADDIKKAALWAVLGSLIVVFLYILLRFRKMSYSIGAVVAVFHDVLIVLGIFSILYQFMPFDMEIGQSFIAAILTVVGYSLNDTVVIFDRIREYAGDRKSFDVSLVDKALSSTLGRTINTSLTTLLVMLAIFFFGGDSIKGFMFALIVGVIVGTYSSLFVATPVMFDTSKEENKE
ncbi:protein translocase subunit SecDF [Tenacibaculum maritimum]|uniref:protein translocase subunit SecDF n=1 Tax=Tenacibaculum maritimum TaxID=107401 RepID=UPI0012E5EF33|nr:protein translocase subunit SecDF [Tenacibaculum maritimum]MCD9582138.1 protein translocase subunit SecDF [Tenacibaculum maritimum]MCD9636547.1 protein translocase subunit SecDF [Tenacibaculum maritimum]CAA0168525.1 Preprotein translocase SecD and SecF subunits [Tenacibaculum maritimum]CAA0208842.1 Preprotein translocase SecD and SecF subunits [Tenacibaculum maritimum]CAA0248048.1 Preprotein translocase SecD and SecF subunits [Tenacibaculum maritimum]